MGPDRDRLIQASTELGMPFELAEQLHDISKHAFDQAFDAMRRIVDTAPQVLRVPITASVLASFVVVMRDSFPDHWKAILEADTSPTETTVIILPERKGPPDFGPGRMA